MYWIWFGCWILCWPVFRNSIAYRTQWDQSTDNCGRHENDGPAEPGCLASRNRTAPKWMTWKMPTDRNHKATSKDIIHAFAAYLLVVRTHFECSFRDCQWFEIRESERESAQHQAFSFPSQGLIHRRSANGRFLSKRIIIRFLIKIVNNLILIRRQLINWLWLFGGLAGIVHRGCMRLMNLGMAAVFTCWLFPFIVLNGNDFRFQNASAFSMQQ